jgi:phosphoglycolate phosphatase
VKPLFQTVVFDFDYTLADSSPAVIECVNTAFNSMGLPPVSAEAIRRTIGTSLPETLVRLAGEQHGARAEEFRTLFRKRSDQIMVDWTTLYAAVPAALQRLREMGCRLAIVSTKYRFRIEATLQREGLLDAFETIIGGDDTECFKPDPQGLLLAAERTNTPAGKMLYAGDSLTDAETARRAGTPFAAILSGPTKREAFSGHTVEVFLDHVGELPAFLGNGA